MIGIYEWLMILATQTPILIFWIAVLIFAVVMLRRGGGRAEKYFIIGVSVKILGNILGIFRFGVAVWISPLHPVPASDVISIITAYDIFIRIISMAGLLLLFYAFWLKFNDMKASETHVE